MERSKYRAFLHSGAMLAEATRAERVKEKRRRRKDRTSPEAGDPALTCPYCGRSIHCTDRTLRPLKVEASTTMTASHSLFIEVPSTSLHRQSKKGVTIYVRLHSLADFYFDFISISISVSGFRLKRRGDGCSMSKFKHSRRLGRKLKRGLLICPHLW